MDVLGNRLPQVVHIQDPTLKHGANSRPKYNSVEAARVLIPRDKEELELLGEVLDESMDALDGLDSLFVEFERNPTPDAISASDCAQTTLVRASRCAPGSVR